jgi:hypothetical protein
MIEHNATIQVDLLLHHLEQIGILPSKVSRSDLQNFIQNLVATTAAFSNCSPSLVTTLTFSDFLLIVGELSSIVSLYESPDSHGELVYHSGLHLVVQTISEYLLAIGLQRWKADVGPSSELSRHSISSSSFYSLQTILLLCRQGGFVQSIDDLFTIVSTVTSMTEPSKNSSLRNPSKIVPDSQIPQLLSTLSRKCARARQPNAIGSGSADNSLIFNTNSTDQYLLSLVGGSEISSDALAIASSHPQLLFVSRQPFPSLLESLYRVETIQHLRIHQPNLLRLLTRLRDENSDFNHSSGSQVSIDFSGISRTAKPFLLSKLFVFLRSGGVIPQFVDEQKAYATVNYLLEGQSQGDKNLLTEKQLLESLYGLAQIAFGGIGELDFSPSPEAIVLKRDQLKSGEFIWVALSHHPALLRHSLESHGHGGGSVRAERFPQIAIEDESERFLCWLEVCDPLQWNRPPLERLRIQLVDDSSHLHSLVMNQPARSLERQENHLPVVETSRNSTNSNSKPFRVPEFSSHFSYLFTQLLTITNMHRYQFVDFTKIDHRFEMTFMQKTLVLLLSFYPINDFSFSPWDLCDLITQLSNAREDKNYLLDSDANFSNVQLDLRQILIRYQISGEAFEQFLEHIIQTSSATSPPLVPSSSTLSSLHGLGQEENSGMLEELFPYLPFLLSGDHRQLLKEGGFLFVWEYLRCLRGNDRNDFVSPRARESGFPSRPNPFMEPFHAPFPSRLLFDQHQAESALSWKAIIQWALIHHIDSFVCQKWYGICCCCSVSLTSGRHCGSGLHYSSFTLFAILCYVDMRLLTQRPSSSSSRHVEGALSDVVVSEAIKWFFQTVTTHIQKFQQASPPCLFPMLLEADTTHSFPRAEVELLLEIVIASLLPGNNSFPSVSSSSFSSSLPLSTNRVKFAEPIPSGSSSKSLETTRWDAGRWLQFCKQIGLTELIGSLPQLWSMFVTCLLECLSPHELEAWDSSVVPPLTIKINPSIVYRCLSRHFDVNRIISSNLIPYLAAAVDDDTFPLDLQSSPSTGRDQVIHFEDLFRYGGQRMINSLESSSSWLHEFYFSLAEPTLTPLTLPMSSHEFGTEPPPLSTHEPLLTTVCRFIASSKLVTLGSVSLLVKQSFGFRTRCPCSVRSVIMSSTSVPNSLSSSLSSSQDYEVSLSLSEVTELVLRCAFQVWERLGLMKPKEKDWYGIGLFQTVQSIYTSLDDQTIALFCEECRKSISNSQLDRPVLQHLPSSHRTLSGGNTWGVDFLTPFCRILQLLDLPVNSSKEKLLLLAQEIQTEKIKSYKAHVPLPVPQAVSLSEQEKKESNNLRPQLVRQLQEMDTATRRLKDDDRRGEEAEEKLKSVMMRSEELVATILAKRDEYEFLSSISHPPSPPLVVKEQTRALLSPASQRVASFQSKERLHRRQERMTQLAEMREKQREKTPSPQAPVLHIPIPSHQTPLRRVKESHRVKAPASPTSSMKLLIDNSLFAGIQEALWPVFATYCSCGDSTDPGKLSGPNLFTLLSKLDILTNRTTLSDIGILLHQISAHSLSLSPFISAAPLSDPQATAAVADHSQSSSPLLSFEEFIIFLCAFAELRDEGVVHLPSFVMTSSALSTTSSEPQAMVVDHEQWLKLWNNYFSNSRSFSVLFHERILPVVNQSLLLASPDDARERDVHSLLFSLDVLFSIETVEKMMQELYLQATSPSSRQQQLGQSQGGSSAHLLVSVSMSLIERLRAIKLIPQVVTEGEVKQLFLDIIPSSPRSSECLPSTLHSDPPQATPNRQHHHCSSLSGSGSSVWSPTRPCCILSNEGTPLKGSRCVSSSSIV